MKRILLTITALLVAISAAAQRNASIEEQLREIRHRDQSIRQNLISSQINSNIDSLVYYAEQMAKIDAKNQAYVANLLKTQGIPADLSEEAYSAIFLVVDHADINYQRRYFKPLKRAAKEGKFKPSQINTLHDRIMMGSNRRQLYGTQTQSHTTIIEGEPTPQQLIYVWPVRRAHTIDARRQRTGLSSMESQAKVIEEVTKGKVIWDRKLSIKEVKKLLQAK
ncbi:MAG: hypothetical protein IKY82_04595 [Alistipes sp.]|nr:hypothetical protein [Alistipes sp.]